MKTELAIVVLLRPGEDARVMTSLGWGELSPRIPTPFRPLKEVQDEYSRLCKQYGGYTDWKFQVWKKPQVDEYLIGLAVSE